MSEEQTEIPDGHFLIVDQKTGTQKVYEGVASRLKRFRIDHPKAGIMPHILHCDEDVVRMRVEIRVDSSVIAVGHAEEYRADIGINATSALENCETSALGRALAIAGYGSADTIASAEEINGANRKTKAIEEATPGALVLLQNAAPGGTKSLEKVWIELGKDEKLACRKYLPNLKRIAAQKDKEIESGA